MPTLITANRSQTNAAIRAAKDALAQGVAGTIGLHLEGPHLSVARNGAHDPALIRKMETTDCENLCGIADDLPSLMITVAPESVTNEQIAQLNHAGVIISLGHTNVDYNTINSAVKSGAISVTHLFNAMSQLENRAPGLVGATLDSDVLFAGLIADGIHVDPAVIRIALRAKQGAGQIFLVTDSMSTIGTDITEFALNERKIFRRDGRLMLSDGTLAGADLTMISAVQFMINEIHIDIDEALRMASLYPAQLLNREKEIGSLVLGAQADFIHLDNRCQIMSVWRGENCVVGAD